MLSSPVQSVLYAVITKSVGSGYRVRDDWKAPAQVRQNTLQREGMLLALTTAFATGIQFLYSKALQPLLERTPAGKYELLLRAIATAPALIFAEGVSRKFAPKRPWVEEVEDEKAPDRFERQAEPVAAMAGGATEQRFSASGPFQAMQLRAHPALAMAGLPQTASFPYDRRQDDED